MQRTISNKGKYKDDVEKESAEKLESIGERFAEAEEISNKTFTIVENQL